MHFSGTSVLVEGTARQKPGGGRVLDALSEWRELEGEVRGGPSPPCGEPVGHGEYFELNPNCEYLISLFCFRMIKYHFSPSRKMSYKRNAIKV